MKSKLLFLALLFAASTAVAQTKNNKFGFSAGGTIQHYNGNLGSSLFKFETTCFAGVTSNLGYYLNKSFDLNAIFSIGHFGYCCTEEDNTRVVALEYRCPGCVDKTGMGELRSLLTSGNLAIKYKFANGYILNENSKISPYIYAGAGINYLSDVMKKNCVNVGTHFTINGGIGFKYNLTERINFGYHLALACFMDKKVYATGTFDGASARDPKIEKRKDICMQNALTIGFNF
jgi:hypothetical protein